MKDKFSSKNASLDRRTTDDDRRRRVRREARGMTVTHARVDRARDGRAARRGADEADEDDGVAMRHRGDDDDGDGVRAEDDEAEVARARRRARVVRDVVSALPALETSAETTGGARARVRFFESCAPRALGEWRDARACVVRARGSAMQALSGAGEEMIRYLRDRLGVMMDVDVARGEVAIRHETPAVTVEAARILNLQLEHGRAMSALGHWGMESSTPTPVHGGKSPNSSLEEEAIREVTRAYSPEALEAIRTRLESKRATRKSLLAHLGEPRDNNQSQSIALTNTLVRVRLPRRKSFSEERLYGVGVALRADASFTPEGKPTWMFVCDMGGSKYHNTDVMYISNEPITIGEVCRMMAKRRGIENTPEDVMADFF
jgi:hypothetical protein